MRFDEYPYGSIAAVYDGLASLYSMGRIAASKRIQIEAIRPGERILYVGVGRGTDALEAARRGAEVTAIDLSANMLARLSRRLEAESLECDLLLGDAARHPFETTYDVVVAHYFLNLFETRRASEMLGRLVSLLAPAGRLWLADFARPQGGLLGRLATELYYRPANWIAWAFGFCALHPILDYPALLEPHGLKVVAERRLPVFLGQNPAFVSIEAARAS